MTSTAMRACLAATALAGLAACDSGGSSDGGGRASYAELSQEFDDLAARGEDLDFADPFALPASGSSTYEGIMGLSSDGDGGVPVDMTGEMTMVADFGDDSVDGTVENFVTASEEELTGSLDLSQGAINRVDPDDDFTVDFDLDGTLTDRGGDDFEVTAEGFGYFFGNSRQQAVGLVDGIITSDQGGSFLSGAFVTER